MALIIALLFCGCASEREDTDTDAGSGEGVYTKLSEIEEKRIGVLTGSIQALQAEERFPGAQLFYYSSGTDMLNALKAGKIDAFAEAGIIAQYMMGEDPSFTYIDEYMADGMNSSAIFPKTEDGRKLCEEYNAFLRKIKTDGEYDLIYEAWTSGDESKQNIPDLGSLPDVNGMLDVAAELTMVPFMFIRDNKPAGIDIEVMYRFAKENGYAVRLENMDFGAIIPAIKSGKSDFSPGGVTYTEERAQSVLFSEPTYEGVSVIAVLKKDVNAEGFPASLAASFEKTFLRESRWKLFASGIVNTLIITVLSVLSGTLLGFAAFLLCRKGNPAVCRLTDVCIHLIHGMPVVVFLMVLYYIIFGSTDLSGMFVSVIAFSLIFGAGMFGMLKSGVNAVDKGQTEAAYALGYTDRQAFFEIILPQAALHFMPDYNGQVVSLLKATAVVGYIAVQDLTKMGDLVRSRTYEAFFPLIAVTVIYFILAAVLIRIINRLTRYIDPKNRSTERILKGVNIHD